MTPEIDWSITTFEGNRLLQMRRFQALSFREKMMELEAMAEVAALFARSRERKAGRREEE